MLCLQQMRIYLEIKKLLNIFNQSSNKDGEIIKVILISPVGGEGITLKRVREVHSRTTIQ